MAKMKRENSLWVEKYRPKELDEYIGNEHIKTKARDYIETNDPPHLLFYGRAGTGKTTLAKILAEKIDCDKQYINASDENSVDTIRNKIKGFASSVGFSALKLIILDEADYITPSGQAALRNMMEVYSATTRFILTCNFHEKIIDPIVSRCQAFHVYPPSKNDVAKHLATILKTENVSFEVDDVVLLVNAGYPDIRKVINGAQRNVNDGVLSINKETLIESDFKMKLVELLKEKVDTRQKFQNVRKFIANNKVSDFNEVIQHLYYLADEVAPNQVANLIILLNEAQKNDAFVVDKEINFMHLIIELIKLTKE